MHAAMANRLTPATNKTANGVGRPPDPTSRVLSIPTAQMIRMLDQHGLCIIDSRLNEHEWDLQNHTTYPSAIYPQAHCVVWPQWSGATDALLTLEAHCWAVVVINVEFAWQQSPAESLSMGPDGPTMSVADFELGADGLTAHFVRPPASPSAVALQTVVTTVRRDNRITHVVLWANNTTIAPVRFNILEPAIVEAGRPVANAIGRGTYWTASMNYLLRTANTFYGLTDISATTFMRRSQLRDPVLKPGPATADHRAVFSNGFARWCAGYFSCVPYRRVMEPHVLAETVSRLTARFENILSYPADQQAQLRELEAVVAGRRARSIAGLVPGIKLGLLHGMIRNELVQTIREVNGGYGGSSMA